MSQFINLFACRKTFLPVVVLLVIFFIACVEDEQTDTKFGFRTITGFQVLPENNPDNIFVGHVGIINNEQKTITISLPASADITSIKPAITVSPYSKVTPASLEPINLSDEVEYVVEAQNGRKSYYRIICNQNYLYTGATLMAVTLTNITDEENIPVRILFSKNKATYTLPADGNLSNVELLLEPDPYSQHATYFVNNKITSFSEPIDFTNYPTGLSVMMISENNKNFSVYTISIDKAAE